MTSSTHSLLELRILSFIFLNWDMLAVEFINKDEL